MIVSEFRVLLFSILLFAGGSLLGKHILNIESFTSEDGFDQQGVYSIHRDSTNKLWIGTEDGIVIYDGSRFQRLSFEGIDLGKDIRVISGGKNNSIYIGTTQNGLFKLSNKDTLHWNESNGFPSNHIRDVVEYNDGIWVATFSGGLVHVESEKVNVYDIENELPSNTVRALAVHQGNLFVGTDFGLVKFDGEYWETIEVGSDFISSLILSFHSDGETLFIGTQKGLFEYNNGVVKSVSNRAEISNARIKAIIKDQHGTLYLGTRNGIIKFQIESNELELINEENGLGGSRIRCLLKGVQGQIWVGTYFGGLSLLISEGISLNDDSSLGGDNAYNQLFTNGNASALALYNAGFIYNDADTSYHSYVANGLSSDVVTGVQWLNDSVYLVATQEGLVHFVNHELLKTYDQYNLNLNTSGFKLLQRFDNQFFSMLDDGTIVVFESSADSLKIVLKTQVPKGVVINHAIYFNGNIWLAGAKGIYKYLKSGKVLKVHGLEKEVVHLFVWRNELYGLNVENTIESISEIGIKQKIHFSISDQISWVQPVGNRLFLNLNEQLITVNSEGEVDVIPVSTILSKVKAFPFASVYSNNLIKIGTVSGIMNIQPEMLLKSDRKIGVHLQEISNDLNQINWKEYQFDDGEIIFPPEFHQLSFYVISDELAYPNGVLYRFKLEGEDDEFVSTFILSKISYSGLSSGNYKLWVQCKPPMGEWSEPKMVVGFEIETPFYKNPWLLGILFIFFVAIIYAFVWVRTKRLEIEKAKLEKLVHERTSELSAEKQKTDELLLNILPAEIADELKRNGSAEARGYEKVSILFTDFKGFTTISGKIPPKELVKDLDEIFAAFDDIVAKHDLEKIKTIGDAYMCVGGVPNVSEHHARNTILAGKDMVKFMEEFNARKRATGKDEWLIRVGVHSGPIVAGVVGKSKFAYDVWGDSVNVASRMESASEPGRINVSAETYNLAKEEFTFEYRGALQVKNKGDLDMYFVN